MGLWLRGSFGDESRGNWIMGLELRGNFQGCIMKFVGCLILWNLFSGFETFYIYLDYLAHLSRMPENTAVGDDLMTKSVAASSGPTAYDDSKSLVPRLFRS